MTPTHPDADDRRVLEPGCARCPALVESRTRISWGNGPTDADVMVVGEAPGSGNPDAETWKGGNHTGFAYTSRHSGRRIRALFDELGYGERTYYTNAVKCFPRGDDGSNREPAGEELANCRTHLETELELIDPTIVVATGKHATRTVLAFEGRTLGGFLDAVLEPVDCAALGVRLLPILHPSYQEVWLSRLGYTGEEYREEIAAKLP
ncbi:uracil-DNA glycosylase [Halegenticoccus tardaugens]|uniref:uracil-DNA glycosylase n=1 Tax=Halegenticoccus tardaugens TaxID=2071624 RepID=UPI00100A5E76|nr:uracil-DNA glycosylase family protein [Halegenticoccus tardaugens]